MKKKSLITAVAFCLLGWSASSALADYVIEYAGDNPWGVGPDPIFPNTGGTATHTDTSVEKWFTSLGDIPIIIHWESSQSTGVIVNGAPLDEPGPVEFLHITETVHNNSGQDWTDFHLVM